MAEFKKQILLGKIDETVYVLRLIYDETKSFIDYEGYAHIYDDDEGERRAKDYLTSDPYFWKDAVANDRTTDGLEDYADHIIRFDGWQLTVGEDNIHEIGWGYYCDVDNYTEGDNLPEDDYDYYDEIRLEKDDFEALKKAIEDDDYETMKDIFSRYQEYKYDDLEIYVNG